MRRISLGLFLVALVTLASELILTRAFDVMLRPNLAYMVITCAMFALGLAGIYAALRPFPNDDRTRSRLAILAAILAVCLLGLRSVLNVLPFDFDRIPDEPLLQLMSFAGMYLVLMIPFFFAGLIFTAIFSAYAPRIQSLYFWDLTGAAVGCVILVPLLSPIGPGGILYVLAGFAFFAVALFAPRRGVSALAIAAGLGAIAPPVLHAPEYYDFREHQAKRGVKQARQEGRIEFTHWDPVSKIDVVAVDGYKALAYDGGSQSSFFFPFDGDYGQLRANLPEVWFEQFRDRRVLAVHHLKRGTSPRVLVIGSAGGREVKAALTYDAREVDAVELVGAVVRLGQDRYGEYSGGVYNDPRVNAHVTEGRSFLRSVSKPYDVIQIYSNHTSSSIASGTGALATTYLQTTEAYREFFSQLTEDGVLQVNHHIYPRMITTAALAWRQLGREDFQRHVVVFSRPGGGDTLPTLLVKMQPWTPQELRELEEFFLEPWPGDGRFRPYRLVEDPLNPEQSFLSTAFFSGALPETLRNQVPFRVFPTTDDKPFFNFLRKRASKLEPDSTRFVNDATADQLNSQLQWGDRLAMDVLPLITVGLVSLFFATVFILLPLGFSGVGRTPWAGKIDAMIYFSCLGAGFIVIELTFIHIFMKLIGSPLYTYSVVVFALLFGAGVGSHVSSRLGITPNRRWAIPFLGVLVLGGVFWLTHYWVFHQFLAAATPVRVAVAVASIVPLGFFLGMPFPLGILAIATRPAGAVPWAWGLNGFFTVVGGAASVVLATNLGFRATLAVAMAIYGLAFWSFSRLRRSEPAPAGSH